MWVTRDDVKLHVTAQGRGPDEILWLHCWGGDHTFFAPQLEHFASRHRVVALDFRGHGRSDAPQQGYAVADLAADAAAVAHEHGLVRPWVVGHSMGGNVALELARSIAVRGVAVLDSVLLPPPQLAQAFAPVIEGLQTSAWTEVVRGFTGTVGGFADAPERRAELIARLTANPQHVMLGCLLGVAQHDEAAALAALRAPLCYIGSGGGWADLTRLRELVPEVVVGQVLGSGHYLPLEVPDQLHSMLERWFRVTA